MRPFPKRKLFLKETTRTGLLQSAAEPPGTLCSWGLKVGGRMAEKWGGGEEVSQLPSWTPATKMPVKPVA